MRSALRRGATFDTTEMVPNAPAATDGMAMMSSPESWTNSGPIAARCCEMRATLPVASFTPAMFFSS